MSVAYKNFWSLNTDEAVVAGILRNGTNKQVEVFMPLNAQMKGVDLLLMNIKKRKSVTLQIKGSRAYEPRKSEIDKNVHGSAGWFYFSHDVIYKATADYFIFLVYVIEQSPKTGRRAFYPHIVAIPTKKLQSLVRLYKKEGATKMYNFFLWVNYKKKEAFDFRDKKYFLSAYLDKKGLDLLNKEVA